MGDYKLKSAADYVVPDHLRMNTEKARARLLVLKDLVSAIILFDIVQGNRGAGGGV